MATTIEPHNARAVRTEQSVPDNPNKVTASKNGNASFSVRETSGKSGKHKNVVQAVLARTGRNGKTCPDISEFFKGDDEKFKELL